MKSKFVKVEDMDFVTGLDEVMADTYDEPPPKNIWEKFWLWIVSVVPGSFPLDSVTFSFASTVLDDRKLRMFSGNLSMFSVRRRSTQSKRCNADDKPYPRCER